jgi:hypothetical protein
MTTSILWGRNICQLKTDVIKKFLEAKLFNLRIFSGASKIKIVS